MSSNLQNSIDSVTGTALVYKDYITGTCFTGSQTLGAGHNLISGKQGADLIAKSLVGGTNVTLSSDDSTITINASAGGGGGGSCGENGIGPGSMSGIAERSNFAGGLPDVIWGATNNAALRTPLYFTEMDMNAGTPDRVYYRPINYPQTVYIEFNNDANGTHRLTNGAVSGLVDGGGNDFSLKQYVSSGYAAFYNSGCGGGSAGGGGSSSAGGGAFAANKFVNDVVNFTGTLPDAILIQDAYKSSSNTNTGVFYFDGRLDTDILQYIKTPANNLSQNHKWVRFNNDASGTVNSSYYAWDPGDTTAGVGNGFSLSLADIVNSGYAVNFGGGSAGGGGSSSCFSGVTDWSGISDTSNLYTGIPENIFVELANGYYSAQLQHITNTNISYSLNPTEDKYLTFDNNAQGTFKQSNYTYTGPTQTWVAGTAGAGGSGPSLSGLISSGYSHHGGGCSSSAGGTLPVSGLQNNKFLKGSANANNFERDLPDAVFVTGAGGAAGSLIKVDFVGNAANNYYMYGRQVNQNLNCRIDFKTTDVSGTINSTPSNCSTPYASLAEMIDSGAAIYY